MTEVSGSPVEDREGYVIHPPCRIDPRDDPGSKISTKFKIKGVRWEMGLFMSKDADHLNQDCVHERNVELFVISVFLSARIQERALNQSCREGHACLQQKSRLAYMTAYYVPRVRLCVPQTGPHRRRPLRSLNTDAAMSTKWWRNLNICTLQHANYIMATVAGARGANNYPRRAAAPIRQALDSQAAGE